METRIKAINMFCSRRRDKNSEASQTNWHIHTPTYSRTHTSAHNCLSIYNFEYVHTGAEKWP